MPRSPPRTFAYNRNRRGDEMIPARASESAATPRLERGGTITRTGRPCGEPHAARAHARPSASRLTRMIQRVLEEHCCRESVDVSLSTARRATHLLYRP